MAFDGITISAIVAELNEKIIGGRLSKIAQPETDELLLTIKGPNGNYRLLMSADAGLPLLYLTEKNKTSPLTAPNFCMLLRKHLQNGKILSISQPGLERVVEMKIEHLDEMGDLKQKTLVIEIMGKHSNIIFCDENGTIIDSIKHVSAFMSSVREVLPGKPYFIPKTQDKADLISSGETEGSQTLIDKDAFIAQIKDKPQPVFKAIYTSFTGLSPVIAQEFCHLAGLDGDVSCTALTLPDLGKLYDEIAAYMDRVLTGSCAPTIVYRKKQPIEYAVFPLSIYSFASEEYPLKSFTSVSSLLEQFYEEKSTYSRIRQKSVDLRKVVQTALERNVKKYDLQLKQMKDTEKRDTYRIYGELLNTYGYSAKPGDKKLTCTNYYTGEEVTIPLDETLSATDNAKRYFEKYNKQKRTFEALTGLTQEVKEQIEHLESIQTALDIAVGEEDLVEIRQELAANGYIKKHSQGGKKQKITSKPFHYVSSDGYDLYVGKNNFQNDELTFKFANGGDWWFHAKKMPGSHVILRVPTGAASQTLPDRAFEEAARLAAFYSKGKDQEKVEIDYVRKKEVKKPSGAKPGFVVYYTNYSMAIEPDISMLKQVNE